MWLLHHSQAYIDSELHDMLEEMLVDGYFGKATAFLASSASVTTDVITEDIIRMNQVVKNIGDWKDKLASV